jgi:hypothetical protein
LSQLLAAKLTQFSISAGFFQQALHSILFLDEALKLLVNLDDSGKLRPLARIALVVSRLTEDLRTAHEVVQLGEASL